MLVREDFLLPDLDVNENEDADIDDLDDDFFRLLFPALFDKLIASGRCVGTINHAAARVAETRATRVAETEKRRRFQPFVWTTPTSSMEAYHKLKSKL